MTWNEFKASVDAQLQRLDHPEVPPGDLEIQYIDVGYPDAVNAHVDDDTGDLCILNTTRQRWMKNSTTHPSGIGDIEKLPEDEAAILSRMVDSYGLDSIFESLCDILDDESPIKIERAFQ